MLARSLTADPVLAVLAAGWFCFCVYVAWVALRRDAALFAAVFMLVVGVAPFYWTVVR